VRVPPCFLFWLLSAVSLGVHATEAAQCPNPEVGYKPTAEELQKILDAHRQWVESQKKEGQRAVLCNANLSGVTRLTLGIPEICS
jgi:hypothetical protein